MISKRESNKIIDTGVLKLCVDTLKNPPRVPLFPNQIETCEKILRNQFGYASEAIERFKHPSLKEG